MAAVWPMMPCYNNLVLFDPLKKEENERTIIGELAEKWAWQEGGKALVFHLRSGVKWHDGQPFTLEGREVHLRRPPGGARRAGQASRQSPEALVREHRGHRDAESRHGDLPPEAAPAVSPPDARLRVFPGVPGPRADGGAANEMRRHRPLQAEGVPAGRIHRLRQESRLLHQGPPLPGRDPVSHHQGAGHPLCRPPGGSAGCLLSPGNR